MTLAKVFAPPSGSPCAGILLIFPPNPGKTVHKPYKNRTFPYKFRTPERRRHTGRGPRTLGTKRVPTAAGRVPGARFFKRGRERGSSQST